MWSDLLNESNLSQFQVALLDWFQVEQRDFPWRRTSNPYFILIAEKLLQQTVARSTVINAYMELISRYPEPSDLACSDVDEVARIILPLGLVYRAKELRAMMQEIMETFGGRVPSNLKQLLKLTGVGEYCARAVMVFAFGERLAVVDTNVARILYRLFDIKEPFPANPARKKQLVYMAEDLMPRFAARDYNLAILDLSAKICRPRTPLCNLCPVRTYCLYGAKNSQPARSQL